LLSNSAFIVGSHLKALMYGSQFYLQITPYLFLPRMHSPDGATTDWGSKHLIAAYYSDGHLIVSLMQK